jgi:hypothetical protein
VRFDAWYVRFMGNPQICLLKKRRNISGWEMDVNSFRERVLSWECGVRNAEFEVHFGKSGLICFDSV